MCQKEKLIVLSNFIFCHYVDKKPSTAEASESVYMRERVKEEIKEERLNPGCKKKEQHPTRSSRFPSCGLNSLLTGSNTTQYCPRFNTVLVSLERTSCINKIYILPFPSYRSFLTPLQQTTFWKHCDIRRNCSKRANYFSICHNVFIFFK